MKESQKLAFLKIAVIFYGGSLWRFFYSLVRLKNTKNIARFQLHEKISKA
jgi:hypothetical protein